MIPWFQMTVWHIGPIPIQVWGFFVALGMLLSLGIIWRVSRWRGLPEAKMLDLALWMILGGVIGARFAHIVFYEPQFFLAHPAEIIKIWHGGLSSFGGIGGAMAAFFLFQRKKSFLHASWLKMADLLSFSALFGWMFGRLGCVMIHDHLGKPCNCFFAIQTPTGPRLEMALLEIIGLIPLALIFFTYRKKQMREGWFLAVLFVYYGVLRFILDFFRATDIAGADVRYFGLTPGQYFAILLVVIGGWLLIKKRGRFA